MATTKEIKISKFDTIAENLRDLPNGQFHYLENLGIGDFDSYAKQVPNVTTLSQDQCILKLIKYGSTVYGIGFDNTTNKDVTLYKWVTDAFVALTDGTVASGTIRLYAPFFAFMGDYIYFDGGTNFISRWQISTTTMDETWVAHTGGMLGGTAWRGDLYGWCDIDNEVYQISDAAVTSMIVIPEDQTVKELIPFGNYLAIVCTASTLSDDGVSRMYLWDGVTTTTFTDIIDIGYGIVEGGDILDGMINVVVGFNNRKGFRIKTYSGGIFQTVYTYYGRNNLVTDYLYCMPASVVKAYTGFLYFMMVGARPGSTYSSSYEAVLMRYGRNTINETNKLSVYKSLEVIPIVGNTLGILGNDFIISEEVNPAAVVDNSVYAVVYESAYKTRQIVSTTSTYSGQPGAIETSAYSFGDVSKDKQLKAMALQFAPLPATGQITLKYKADAETDWTTVCEETTPDDVFYNVVNVESTGANLPTFNEIAFRVELLGGATLTSFNAKAEELGDIYG